MHKQAEIQEETVNILEELYQYTKTYLTNDDKILKFLTLTSLTIKLLKRYHKRLKHWLTQSLRQRMKNQRLKQKPLLIKWQIEL